ncbi:BtpA/SgcQ family protein [Patescibacteria group bacterium]
MFSVRNPKRPLPEKAIIGMIHVRPLPQTVWYADNMDFVIRIALEELAIYKEAGVDAVMLENMFDVPYSKPPLHKDTVSAMCAVAYEVRKHTEMPIGIQMLEAANCDAMNIAIAADLDFIRAEGFVYAHIGGAGIIEGSAREILKLRANADASHIQVWADVKKKHCAHALTADLTIRDVVRQSDFFCADRIIITGDFTGTPVDIKDIGFARVATDRPIVLGSGVNPDNIYQYHSSNAFIVGSYFKQDGDWKNPLDPERVKRLIQARDRFLI